MFLGSMLCKGLMVKHVFNNKVSCCTVYPQAVTKYVTTPILLYGRMVTIELLTMFGLSIIIITV